MRAKGILNVGGYRSVWLLLTPVVLTAVFLPAAGGFAATLPADMGMVRRSTDFATPASLTAGIQEAVDSLPATGGMVYIPEGIHVVHRPIVLRPDTLLAGAGTGSIIRKDPAVMVFLAEDIRKGTDQDYVVVADASRLKPGMFGAVGDTSGDAGDVIVDRVEGNRVYLKSWGIYDLKISGPWKPSQDVLVSRKAAFFNAFPILRTSDRCVLSNLAFDGNRENQKVDGKELYRDYGAWWNRLRCVPYMGGFSRLENCRVYGAAGVAVSLGWTATVQNCDIADSYQGIHPGAGPYSRRHGNRVHHNEHAGIMLCLGNYGLIISANHIYDNEYGIWHLGDPEDRGQAVAETISASSATTSSTGIG